MHTSQTGVARAVVASFDAGDKRAFESSTMRTGESVAKSRQPAGEVGIVGRHRAGADQDRVMRGAQAMAVGARRLAGDPLALARRGGDAAVERGRDLEVKERPALPHAQQEAGVDLGRLGRALADLDGDAAAFSRACPWPFTRGSGSSSAETTRATPAAISASAQGGVRP